MKLLEKFNRVAGFTSSESRIVLFLSVTLLGGVAIRLLNFGPQKEGVYDYSTLDSEYNARSKNLILTESSIVPLNNSSDDSMKLFNRTGKNNFPSSSIDLNAVTKDQLVRLPGIGEAIAERIIIYRDEHGAFKSVDGLLKVKGIGKKKLERIAPMLSVGK